MPMFSFLHRSAPQYPTIRQALSQAGLASATDPSAVTVLERHGSYSGRRVTFFRAFDPARAAARSIDVREFADLDSHPELILGSGHLEPEGGVTLTRRRAGQATDSFARELADRTIHGDDDKFVFPAQQRVE